MAVPRIERPLNCASLFVYVQSSCYWVIAIVGYNNLLMLWRM